MSCSPVQVDTAGAATNPNIASPGELFRPPRLKLTHYPQSGTVHGGQAHADQGGGKHVVVAE
jgi:hypothetical protein